MEWRKGAAWGVYELLEALEGTSDKLWRARHAQTGVAAVVKRLDPDGAERYALERLLARKPDPRYLITFQALDDEAAAMEAWGETLDVVLRRGLAEGLRPAVVAELFRALAVLHGAGLFHGDLKPLNVLLDLDQPGPEGAALSLRLIDFGLSGEVPDGGGLLHSLSGTQMAVGGTPLYLDPALAEGRSLGPRSDLYAAGVIAHEVLAGRKPAYGESLPQWLRRCLGPWEARHRDAGAALGEVLAALAAGGGIAAGSPAAAAVAPGALARGSEEGLRAWLREVAAGHRGEAPLDGASFLEVYAEAQERGLAAGWTRDELRRLLGEEAARWREGEARRAAEEAEAALWAEARAKDDHSAYEGYLARTALGRHREAAGARLTEFQRAEEAAQAAEEALWREAQAADTAAAYTRYLSASRQGAHRGVAEERLAVRRDAQAWEAARAAGTEEALERYLAGPAPLAHEPEARERLTALRHADAKRAYDEAARGDTLRGRGLGGLPGGARQLALWGGGPGTHGGAWALVEQGSGACSARTAGARGGGARGCAGSNGA